MFVSRKWATVTKLTQHSRSSTSLLNSPPRRYPTKHHTRRQCLDVEAAREDDLGESGLSLHCRCLTKTKGPGLMCVIRGSLFIAFVVFIAIATVLHLATMALFLSREVRLSMNNSGLDSNTTSESLHGTLQDQLEQDQHQVNSRNEPSGHREQLTGSNTGASDDPDHSADPDMRNDIIPDHYTMYGDFTPDRNPSKHLDPASPSHSDMLSRSSGKAYREGKKSRRTSRPNRKSHVRNPKKEKEQAEPPRHWVREEKASASGVKYVWVEGVEIPVAADTAISYHDIPEHLRNRRETSRTPISNARLSPEASHSTQNKDKNTISRKAVSTNDRNPVVREHQDTGHPGSMDQNMGRPAQSSQLLKILSNKQSKNSRLLEINLDQRTAEEWDASEDMAQEQLIQTKHR